MIYIIGGPPRIGKTKIAREVAKTLPGIGFVSTDDIRETMRRCVDRNSYPDLFPLSGEEDMNVVFKDNPIEKLVKLQNAEAHAVWEGIDGFLKKALKYKREYIIEGVHLLPEDVNSHPQKNEFNILYLVNRDREKLKADIMQYESDDDWFVSKIDSEILEKAMDFFGAHSEYYYSEAKKYGFYVFEMSSTFDESVEEVKKIFVNSAK